ncbi:MAG: phosphoribosylaminoimidazolecarboxamide formyltransferase, partial [Mitsuokella sp.]
FVALSDECDAQTASFLKREVSDGIIAPSYSPEALEILKSKRKGTYLILQMDPSYEPEEFERKQVFGVTFEQKRNDVKITEDCLKDIATKNHDLPESAKRDLLIALITLKYTQSNSVCYTKDGQAIGIGAGQQSRVHCTRLAGTKADNWFLRQSPQVLNLPFKPEVRRPDRDNAIDVYIGEEWEDLLETDDWKRVFTEKPPVFTREEKKAWLKKETGVSLGSDAFFPFGDNIERAHKSGVTYVAQTGGSIRDDNVIETADKYNMTMAMTHIRLFHH